MTYRVELTLRAQRDLAGIYAYIRADSSGQAALWFNGLERIILSLAEHPERGSPVPDNRRLRQLLYGNKPHLYRILYAVRRSSGIVYVVHIRHGAMLDLETPER